MTGLTHAFPAIYPDAADSAETPERLELGGARRPGTAGRVGVYVAAMLREGRALFEILGDAFIQGQVDEEPWVLDRLASDSLVVEAIEVQAALADYRASDGVERLLERSPPVLLRVAA
jgi:hypothetical protein